MNNLAKNNEANVLLYEYVEVTESADMDDDNYKALSNTNEKLSTTYRMLRYLHFDLNLSVTNHTAPSDFCVPFCLVGVRKKTCLFDS